jgi:hypothetical protein
LKNTGGLCSSSCEFFRCEQRAVVMRGQDFYCRFADDECTPATCKYTRCVKGRLLPNGRCGLTIKPRELEIRSEELIDPLELPEKLAHKMRMRKGF